MAKKKKAEEGSEDTEAEGGKGGGGKMMPAAMISLALVAAGYFVGGRGGGAAPAAEATVITVIAPEPEVETIIDLEPININLADGHYLRIAISIGMAAAHEEASGEAAAGHGAAAEGTATVVIFQNTIGSLPTRNYNEGQFESCEDISGGRMVETILKKRDTCYACVVRCKRVVEVNEGPHRAEPKYGGPEYETLGTFGSYCGVNDLAAIALANQICNENGVDTIACGATIAFAMECFEKGIIDRQQTGGLELKFGDADAMLAALNAIVNCEGPLGEVLSKGSERAAGIWGNGAEECLITVKGAEAPAHMPQAKRSLGLIYAVNPFGADHQSSEHDPYYEEGVADLNLNRLKMIGLSEPQPGLSLTPEKVRFAYLTEVFYSMLDSVELCQFVYGPAWTLYGPAETVDMIRAIIDAEHHRVNPRKVSL